MPVEYAADLYARIRNAGSAFGLRDVGYRAVDSLRLEKQYLAWAVDIRSDNNPYEAGLSFAVRPDKPDLVAGPALRKIRDEGVTQRLCWFSADPGAVMHGGELLAHPERSAGDDRAQRGLRPHGAAHDLLGVPAGRPRDGDRLRRGRRDREVRRDTARRAALRPGREQDPAMTDADHADAHSGDGSRTGPGAGSTAGQGARAASAPERSSSSAAA